MDALLLHYKEISPVKKVPDDIAEIERRLLAIVGAPEQIDKDFEEIVDDEEMLEEDVESGEAEDAASRIEVENVHKDSDNNIRDIKKGQAELIKMQEISDDEIRIAQMKLDALQVAEEKSWLIEKYVPSSSSRP